MRHVFGAQLLALVLAAMVQDDIHGGEPPLELIHPVGQGRQGPHHHVWPIDLVLTQVAQEANGLDLQQQAQLSPESNKAPAVRHYAHDRHNCHHAYIMTHPHHRLVVK